MDRRTVGFRYCIMRQMLVEVERSDVVEQPKPVQVTIGFRGRNISRSRDNRRAKSPLIRDGYVQLLHQRTRVAGKPLLSRHKRVAVVKVFHLALVLVVGKSDVMVRSNQ